MTERRRFNRRERAALFLAADGCCDRCGAELEPGWHADHLNPYANRGPTDVVNGQALCPKCNLQKGRTVPFTPRAWQDEFNVKYAKLDKPFFQLVASVGAGKTPSVYHLLSAMPDTLLLVFAPRLNIVRSWRDTPTKRGFKINVFEGYEPGVEKKIGIGRDYQGLAASYAALGYAPLTFRRLVSRGRWLIVFDENHHLSAEETSSWGIAAREAFTGLSNVRMLGLSGTPFRTDGAPIPFAEYIDNELIIDHKYLYRDAVGDRVVRPIEFSAIDAQARISGPEGGFKDLAIEDARGREIPQVIRSAIDHESDWLIKAITLGWSYVQEDMARIPNAAMIIHTHNVFAANRVAAVARAITGQTPVVVTSGEEENAVDLLSRFEKSQDRILIVVAMASEGTDIARLTVGIHATNVRTRMDFEQRFGRQVRLTPYEKGQNGSPNRPIIARYIIPAAEPHVRFAREIYEEVKAVLQERPEAPGGPGGGGGLGQPVLPASDAELRHTFYGGIRIEDPQSWEMAGQLALKFGIDQMEAYQTLTRPAAATSSPTIETLQERETKLRNRLDRRVKQLANESFDGIYGKAWNWLKDQVGNRDPIPAWPVSDIRRGLRVFGVPDD